MPDFTRKPVFSLSGAMGEPGSNHNTFEGQASCSMFRSWQRFCRREYERFSRDDLEEDEDGDATEALDSPSADEPVRAYLLSAEYFTIALDSTLSGNPQPAL